MGRQSWTFNICFMLHRTKKGHEGNGVSFLGKQLVKCVILITWKWWKVYVCALFGCRDLFIPFFLWAVMHTFQGLTRKPVLMMVGWHYGIVGELEGNHLFCFQSAPNTACCQILSHQSASVSSAYCFWLSIIATKQCFRNSIMGYSRVCVLLRE